MSSEVTMKIFDKELNEITYEEYLVLKNDSKYAAIAFYEEQDYAVSTTWKGVASEYRGKEPLIFETVVVSKPSYIDCVLELSATCKEAKDAHAEIVRKVIDNDIETKQ